MLRLVCLSLLLLACAGDNIGNKNTSEDEKIFLYLTTVGFKESDIIIDDDIVIVEGDIVFQKEILLKDLSSGRSKGRLYTFGSYGKIDINRVNKIYLIVSPDVIKEWKDAVAPAVSAWNNTFIQYGKKFKHSRIHITVGNWDDGDKYENKIQVIPGGGPLADFPQNGRVGQYLRITNSHQADEPYITLLIHEIGHTLGFAHPDKDFHKSDPITGTKDWEKTGSYKSIMISGNEKASSIQYDDHLSAVMLYPGQVTRKKPNF